MRAVFFVVGGERKDDPIVERGAECGALFFADADDLAGDIAPANFFSDGVDARKEIFDEVVANDADRGGLLEVGFGDVATGDEIVPVTETPREFQIRNSNVYSLAAQVARADAEARRAPRGTGSFRVGWAHAT